MQYLAVALLPEVWRRIQLGHDLTSSPRIRLQIMTVLMSKKAFTLTRDEIDLFRYLVKQSDLSPERIKELVRRHYTNHSMPNFIFESYNQGDPLYFNALLTPKDFIPELKVSSLLSLMTKVMRNELFIKIVAIDRYEDFLKQLGDYNYRPKIRAEKPRATHKLVHLTGQVVAYQRHQQKNKPPYAHTKKSSATLLNTYLNTPVFGNQDGSRLLVGYLFDKQHSVVKAMLKQDQGTYAHHWLAPNANEALRAASLIPDYNFTSVEAFNNQVNTSASLTNEVLLKVSRESIMGIAIARMTPIALSVAEARQKDALEKLGVDVPIVQYNRDARKLEIIREKRGFYHG